MGDSHILFDYLCSVFSRQPISVNFRGSCAVNRDNSYATITMT